MEEKNKLVNNIENLTVFLVGFSFLVFPLIFTTVNTDIFSIPKQTLFGIVAIASLILFGAKVALSGSLRIRRTPFDIPLLLLTLAVFLSAMFSLNRSESLLSFVPFFFSVVLFFAIVNSANKDRHFLFLSASLVGGGAVASIITVLNLLKVYILPFEFAKNQTFTPFGNPLDQAIFLGIVFSLCLYIVLPYIKEKRFPKKDAFFFIGGAIAGLGLLASLYVLLVLQRPNILPFSTGFQTAFAAISQDTGRIVQGFLFGSGYGTYLSDFTRFKPATFNLNADIWNLPFIRSSSFALELLATAGVLGFFSFLLLAYRALRIKPLFFPMIAGVVLAFILPFSFLTVSVIFIILGIFSISPFISKENEANFYDEEIKLMSFRKGILGITASSSERNVSPSFIPYVFLAVTLLVAGVLGYFSARFIYSDVLFQRSLIAASQNDGAKTYDLQTKAINTFPYRDGYHRIFSQINLALANNLAASVPQGSSPSAQVQQN
ncbi:MAG: hypothetical protein HY426_04445, partial [Candidatus Levybacteria bacterium]|nr:hypothetical protein [Candidatus Levybacteria bacterium]